MSNGLFNKFTIEKVKRNCYNLAIKVAIDTFVTNNFDITVIKKKEILKIAKLSRLRLEEDEIVSFQKDFLNIFDMCATLQNLNCDDVEDDSTESFDINSGLFLNSDEVKQDCLKEDLFRNIDKTIQKECKKLSYYIVPKILGN